MKSLAIGLWAVAIGLGISSYLLLNLQNVIPEILLSGDAEPLKAVFGFLFKLGLFLGLLTIIQIVHAVLAGQATNCKREE